MLYDEEWTHASAIELFTDASNEGSGAVFGNRWIRSRWSPAILQRAFRKKRISMPFLELQSLVYAALAWGAHWSGKRIIFRSDCQPVAWAIHKMTSRDSDMMRLLRLLDSTAAHHGFDYRCVHIEGKANVVAELLSRPQEFSLRRLLVLLPTANQAADRAPQLPPWRSM